MKKQVIALMLPAVLLGTALILQHNRLSELRMPADLRDAPGDSSALEDLKSAAGEEALNLPVVPVPSFDAVNTEQQNIHPDATSAIPQKVQNASEETDLSERTAVVLSMLSKDSLQPTSEEISLIVKGTGWIGMDLLRDIRRMKTGIRILPFRLIIAEYLSPFAEITMYEKCKNIEVLDQIRNFHKDVALAKTGKDDVLVLRGSNGRVCAKLAVKLIETTLDNFDSNAKILFHAYDPHKKELRFPRERLSEQSIAHEFAHAVGDVLVKDEGFFRKKSVRLSDKDKDLRRIFEAYLKSSENGKTWSIYPQFMGNISEYFATGLQVYIYSPEKLKEHDPDFFGYLKTLTFDRRFNILKQ
ncbi:MAG: hypothetical protein ABIG11_05455 [bacterium]